MPDASAKMLGERISVCPPENRLSSDPQIGHLQP